MKLIRIVFAVVFVILLAFGWYTGVSTFSEANNKFNGYMQAGAFAFENQHYQEAYMAYEDALKVNKTLEVQDKIIGAYEARYKETQEYNDLNELISALGEASSAFPKETKFYERAIELLISDGQYIKAKDRYLQAKDNKVKSDKLEEYLTKIKYSYKIATKNYEEYTESVNGFITYRIGSNWEWIHDDFSEGSMNDYSYISLIGDNDIFCARDVKGEIQFLDIEGIVRGKIKEKDVKSAGLYSEEKVALELSDGFYYTDLLGKRLSGPYQVAGAYRDGKAAVKVSENKWMLIDEKGKQASKDTFEDIVLSLEGYYSINDKAIAKKNGKYAIYTADLSKQVGNLTFDDVDVLTNDGIFAYKSEGKWGYADLDGNVIIKPEYTEAKSFSNGFAAVKNGEYWTLINSDKQVVADDEILEIGYVTKSGTCMVKQKDNSNIGVAELKKEYFKALVFNFPDMIIKKK